MSNNLKIGFSLDMINIHYQEPNRNRYESKYYWEELYPLVVAAGFTAVEIPFDPFWIFRGGSGVPMTKYCIEVKFKTVANYVSHLKQQGINKIAGIHFTPNLFMRNDNLDFYFGASGYFGGEAIRYAKELGCDYINVSPTPPYGLIKHYHGNTTDWEKWLDEFTVATRTTEKRRNNNRSHGESDTDQWLTNRERDVAALVTQGCTNRQVGKRLGITEVTVRHHLTSIFNKLRITNRFQLIAWSYRHGITRPLEVR